MAETPTPWRYFTDTDGRADGKESHRVTSEPITENNGYIIADLYGPDAKDNAALIVRAVNNHERLRAALTAIEIMANAMGKGTPAQRCAWIADSARRALEETKP